MSTDTTIIDPELTAEEQATAEASAQYTSDNVKYLKDADHIRSRPGMYIGDTGMRGLHHLAYELVYNCVDEALAGYCRNIHVTLHVDNSCSVSDDGRGIPVEVHPEIGKSTLEAIFTMVGVGGKFDKGAYKVSLGLHGMGAKAVTALSEWVEAQVQRDGRTYLQEYERGKATTEVKDVGASKRTGTRIHFKPDPLVFHENHFDYDTLETRLRELAFLNKGLALKLTDERTGKEELFKYDGGIAEFVAYLNRDEDVLHAPPIYIDQTVEVENIGHIRVEVAMQYTTSEQERFNCYTNNGANSMGGTHLSGFRDALTRTMKNYGTKQDYFKNVTPVGEDFRKGLTVIISVQHPEPQFNSQTKEKLNNLEVEGVVSGVVSEVLSRYMEENPKEAGKIMKKVALEAEAREAAAKAKKALKERKGLLNGGGMPGKLLDCTNKDREGSELFLVEGDSAGGSAEQGRARAYQAILPLRGKPLNVEKARVENMLNNNEIANLIAAVGIDIGLDVTSEESKQALEDLRYDKIILLSDADVDGQHIRTLLLTFFYRQMPLLVTHGHIYVARPPLYRVTEKKHNRFVQSSDEMHHELTARGLKGTKLAIYPRVDPQASEQAATGEPRRIEGDNLSSLMQTMTGMERDLGLEDSLVTLERRGVNLPAFLKRKSDRGLPIFRVVVGGREEWCYTEQEVDALRERERQRLGRDLVVEDTPAAGPGTAPAHMAADAFFEQELHEVKTINRCLEELRRFGLDTADLLPPERLAGREPPVRLKLESGEHGRTLSTLRDLVSEVRKLGEKGLSVTRFKGLGEMDPEELWETTLDPERRTLMQVKLDDALKADEMFRTLMGEKVEPRRDFIYANAIKVKDLDYHGA
jgi:DNA gyrase subunit B